MIPRPLALVIVSVVTAAWVVTITAPLWHPSAPEPTPAIHAVFMVVVGGFMNLTKSGRGDTIARVLGALRPPPDPPTPPSPESEQP